MRAAVYVSSYFPNIRAFGPPLLIPAADSQLFSNTYLRFTSFSVSHCAHGGVPLLVTYTEAAAELEDVRSWFERQQQTPLTRIAEDLQQFGLTQYEGCTYLALNLFDDPEPARSIAQVSDVPRTKIYQTLNNLEKKDLVEKDGGTRPTLYDNTIPLDQFLEEELAEYNTLIDHAYEDAAQIADTLSDESRSLNDKLDEEPETFNALAAFGFTEYESQAFTVLAHLDTLMPARDIAQSARVPRTKIYAVLGSLVDHNALETPVVFTDHDGRGRNPKHYTNRPVEDVLTDKIGLYEEAVDELKASAETLQDAFTRYADSFDIRIEEPADEPVIEERDRREETIQELDMRTAVREEGERLTREHGTFTAPQLRNAVANRVGSYSFAVLQECCEDVFGDDLQTVPSDTGITFTLEHIESREEPAAALPVNRESSQPPQSTYQEPVDVEPVTGRDFLTEAYVAGAVDLLADHVDHVKNADIRGLLGYAAGEELRQRRVSHWLGKASQSNDDNSDALLERKGEKRGTHYTVEEPDHPRVQEARAHLELVLDPVYPEALHATHV